MAHDVFISYSSHDKLTADAACARLEGAGIRCWIAPRDIAPGRDYGEAIIDAIDEVRVMVLIFSASANQSQQIKREVERAVSKGVTVIPFRIENVAPSRNLEYFISTPHWLDALTPPLEAHLNHLVTTLQQILGSTPLPPHVPPAVSAQSVPVPRRGMGAGLLVALAVLVTAAVAWGARAGSPRERQPAGTIEVPRAGASGKQESVWQGKWSDPAGTTYDFTLDLSNDHGAIAGHFTWILRYAAKTSGSAGQPVGSSAIEYLSGHYDPATAEVELTGHGVSDGNSIAMDSYRLTLARDGRSFTGKSLGHQGMWDNAISGERISGDLSFAGAPASP